MPVRDLEGVYDREIAPLMAQIIAVCKREGMPVLASFQYADESLCTTWLMPPFADDTDADRETRGRLRIAGQMVYEGYAALTVTRRGSGPHA